MFDADFAIMSLIPILKRPPVSRNTRERARTISHAREGRENRRKRVVEDETTHFQEPSERTPLPSDRRGYPSRRARDPVLDVERASPLFCVDQAGQLELLETEGKREATRSRNRSERTGDETIQLSILRDKGSCWRVRLEDSRSKLEELLVGEEVDVVGSEGTRKCDGEPKSSATVHFVPHFNGSSFRPEDVGSYSIDALYARNSRLTC